MNKPNTERPWIVAIANTLNDYGAHSARAMFDVGDAMLAQEKIEAASPHGLKKRYSLGILIVTSPEFKRRCVCPREYRQQYFTDAYLAASTFTPDQRALIIKHGLYETQVRFLVHAKFRDRLLDSLAAGQRTAHEIRRYTPEHPRPSKQRRSHHGGKRTLSTDGTRNPDFVWVNVADLSLTWEGFRTILTRLDQEEIVRAYNRAVAWLNSRNGNSLSHVTLARKGKA